MSTRRWRVVLYALLPCLACLPAVPSRGTGPLESLAGPSDCVAVSGNGGLTVGVDVFGRVSACRWPSPGYHDQLNYRTRDGALPDKVVDSHQGLTWGVRSGNETLWLTGAPWRSPTVTQTGGSSVVETEVSLPDEGLSARQTLFVAPELDVLAIRLLVQGFTHPPEIYWYGGFTPCTRLIPEAPIAGWALDWANDFACFLTDDCETVVHFRPTAPSSLDWALANRLAHGNGLDTDWTDFRNGVWIAYTCVEGVSIAHCGNENEPSCAFAQATSGRLNGALSAVGHCNSAILTEAAVREHEACATVFVAFANNLAAAHEHLASALDLGYDEMLDRTRTYWQEWGAPVDDNQGREIATIKRNCLTGIVQAMDRQSGAVVRAPITQPPHALDWPRHGVWTTLALDVAGKHDLAERHTLFYLAEIREASSPGMPAGSIPAALYADGHDALPHVVLAVDATAWVLWSVWRHSTFLDDTRRVEYLANAWEPIDRAASFLAGWTDPRTDAPAPSFDVTKLRDSHSTALLLEARMGLKSALDIATVLREDRPDWQERLASLDVLVARHCPNAASVLAAAPGAAVRPTAVFPETDPRWQALADGLLARIGTADLHTTIGMLCDVAMIEGRRPETSALLEEKLLELAPRLAERPPVDAYEAAMLFLALESAFPGS